MNKDENVVKTTMDELTKEDIFSPESPNAIEAFNEKQSENIAENQPIQNETVNDSSEPVKRKRGRPKGSASKPQSEKSENIFKNPNESAKSATVEPNADYQSAVFLSGLIEQSSVAMISADFKYNDMERVSNIAAWEATIKHYGGFNIHPVAALAASHMAIIFSRVASSTETQTKFSHLKVWFKGKVSKIFKRKGKKDALSNTGENPIGKDDLRKKESGEPAKN